MGTSKLRHEMPLTDQSLLARAGASNAAVRSSALAQVLDVYAQPLLRFLGRTYRVDPEKAQEILQAFVTRKVLEQALLAKFDPARGRFRSFLIRSLANFANSWIQKNQAAQAKPREWDSRNAPRAHGESPDKPFVREWGREVLRQAVSGMKQECTQKGRDDIWELFNLRVLRPALEDVPPVPYEEIVQRLGLESPREAVNLLLTGTRMCKRHLREVISRYASSPEQIDDELLDLQRAFA